MTARDDFFKLPRLFVDAPLEEGGIVTLTPDQVHYFKTVLRRENDAPIRLFNGRDGEWLCHLQNLSKKSGLAIAAENIKKQPPPSPGVHLYFAPIKKTRMDWLIEKAVELGATHLHPVITQNTEVREVNEKRLRQQIFEAAEQCERLDMPILCDSEKLYSLQQTEGPVLACLERGDTKPIMQAVPGSGPVSILIGPEGGFTAAETEWIAGRKNWLPVSLGPRILRCETAACVALTACLFHPVSA